MANRKPDVNQTTVALVRKAVGGGFEPGEDLIGDPKLKAGFMAAKRKEARRKKK